jgi:hypothetical protein
MFHVVVVASHRAASGPTITTRPPTQGAIVWLECIVRNVGEEWLEDIELVYLARFFRGGHLKPEAVVAEVRYPLGISFLAPGDTYTFYITNVDTLNVSVHLPDGASARIYNEMPRQGVRVRRAPDSTWDFSNALLPGWKLPGDQSASGQ